MKSFRTYRGVKIFQVKEVLPGADFNVTEDGRITPRKPRKEDIQVSYQYAGSYPYDTLEEVKESIDTIYNKMLKFHPNDFDKKEFIKSMNEK